MSKIITRIGVAGGVVLGVSVAAVGITAAVMLPFAGIIGGGYLALTYVGAATGPMGLLPYFIFTPACTLIAAAIGGKVGMKLIKPVAALSLLAGGLIGGTAVISGFAMGAFSGLSKLTGRKTLPESIAKMSVKNSADLEGIFNPSSLRDSLKLKKNLKTNKTFNFR